MGYQQQPTALYTRLLPVATTFFYTANLASANGLQWRSHYLSFFGYTIFQNKKIFVQFPICFVGSYVMNRA